MRLRTVQFACLLLLLTSVGAAQSSARETNFSLGGHYIVALLRQNSAAAPSETPLSRRLDEPALEIPTNCTSPKASVWTMRPPSAQSVLVQTVTGSGV